MTVVSNGQFWIYTIALIIVWIIVLTTAFNNDSNIKNKVSQLSDNNEDELKNSANCKSLCKHCGCLAFYCGEECICECNDEQSDTECIGLIQSNAKRLNIPFEILIQGPTANTFVRKALQFEQNNDRRSFGYRNKRSTVTVYKPNKKENREINFHKIKSSAEGKTLIKDIFNISKQLKERHKRSVEQFNWFGDIRNNLLRPAPLGLKKPKVEESKTTTAAAKTTTISSLFDNSWFSALTPNILTPAPLVKRKKPLIVDDNNENNEDRAEIDDISLEAIKIKTYKPDKQNYNQDFHGNEESENNYSKELKIQKKSNRNSYLPEEKQESQESFTDELSRLLQIDPKRNIFKADSYLPEVDENMFEESQETLTGGVYKGLLKNDLESENEEKDTLLPKEKQKPEPESQETLTGGLYSRLFKGDLAKKGLQELRIPWFKPVNFLEKVKRVISP